MYQPPYETLVCLLQQINGTEVETFTNFPDIVRAGNRSLDKEEVDYLSAEGYLEEKKTDSFGKLLQISPRGRAVLAGIRLAD